MEEESHGGMCNQFLVYQQCIRGKRYKCLILSHLTPPHPQKKSICGQQYFQCKKCLGGKNVWGQKCLGVKNVCGLKMFVGQKCLGFKTDWGLKVFRS